MTKVSDNPAAQNPQELYPRLPGVNEILLTPACCSLLDAYPQHQVINAIRDTLAALRREIGKSQHSSETLDRALAALPERIAGQLADARSYSLKPVINATGVILHTNLGRAPLSQAAIDHIGEVARDYCNLELDLETGERSRRDLLVEDLLLSVLGLQSELHGAVIVNNCAAATFLALNSLAERREVIVSRGELVEIGGGFRIPEILEKSGARLNEVGTTNRTRISDYERAITPDTALILRVHRSNFSIEGFTERPDLADLVSLSQSTGVSLFEDQGTGLLVPLQPHGIAGEATLPASLAHGVDVVAASGDKLLGGPQCGLLVGRTSLIQKINKNPMMRALRVDKLTYAALEATLYEYRHESASELPIQAMLSLRPEELISRCRQIAAQIDSASLAVEVVPVDSLVGGGTAPKATLPSCALALRHATMTAEELTAALRRLDPPIVARIGEGAVLLDLRTVHPRFDSPLITSLTRL